MSNSRKIDFGKLFTKYEYLLLILDLKLHNPITVTSFYNELVGTDKFIRYMNNS